MFEWRGNANLRSDTINSNDLTGPFLDSDGFLARTASADGANTDQNIYRLEYRRFNATSGSLVLIMGTESVAADHGPIGPVVETISGTATLSHGTASKRIEHHYYCNLVADRFYQLSIMNAGLCLTILKWSWMDTMDATFMEC